MWITRIEKEKGKRFRVYGEEGFLFSLYAKELECYRIDEGKELEDEVYETLLNQLLYKRARERALYLLDRRPYTDRQLREKLAGQYPVQVIDRVMVFLQGYGYVDDAEYVRRYLETYAGRRSRAQLIRELSVKGISRDMVCAHLDCMEYDDAEGLGRQMKRYLRGKDPADRAVRERTFRYLYGKGYSASDIQQAFRNYES